MKVPGITISGTNSGCGKTTVSMGIMQALKDMGYAVQPFKAGPDYIDPMFHSSITGRTSRNLDSWLLDERTLKYLYGKNAAGADIAVTEGVMGLYDGIGSDSIEGSTAHIAGLTGTPVILVVNGEAMSTSAAALVKGYAEFNNGTNVKGVLFNRVSGEAHYRLLKQAVEQFTGIPAVGYLPEMDGVALEDRHLGLVTSMEVHDLRRKTDMLSQQIRKTVDLELLVKLAGEANESGAVPGPVHEEIGRVRIAVAKDIAFCFYYKDSLELLENLGAELVFFSPLNEEVLPEDIDGLYIGGGYPELHAGELQQNRKMRADIKRHVMDGMPAYAECGGLQYLADKLQTIDGDQYEMVGLILARSRMTSNLQRFGYSTVKFTEDTVLCGRNSEIRAHEFHYSELIREQGLKPCFEVVRKEGERVRDAWNCGYKAYNLVAGYPHVHFWSNPTLAGGFVKSCRIYRRACGR